MSVVRTFACAAAMLSFAAESSAEVQRMCAVPPPKFPLMDQNRVGARDLAALLPGQSMVFVRRWATGTFNRLRREFHTDGTLVSLCETAPTPDGPWKPCAQTRSGARSNNAAITGNREIGVWMLQGSYFCIKYANIGSALGCFALHRQAGQYYATSVNNYVSCIEGDVTFERGISQ